MYNRTSFNLKFFIQKEVFSMKLYSNKAINIVSIIITIGIYLFLTLYIPKLYSTVKEYIYYKIQPTNMQDY